MLEVSQAYPAFSDVESYFKILIELKQASSDLITEYIIKKSDALIFPLLKKIDCQNTFLKNFILKNFEGINILLSQLLDTNITVHKLLIKRIMKNFIKKLVNAIKKSGCLTDYFEAANPDSFSAFIKSVIEIEDRISEFVVSPTPMVLPLLTLINTENESFSAIIQFEKDFFNHSIKVEAISNIEEQVSTNLYDSHYILNLLKLIIKNSETVLLVTISKKKLNFVKKDQEAFDSDEDADEEPLTHTSEDNLEVAASNYQFVVFNQESTNMFIHVIRLIFQSFQGKFNEQNTLLMSISNKFNHKKLMFCLDLMIQTLNTINEAFSNIYSIYQENKFYEDFSGIIKEFSKLIESYVNAIYKEFKKTVIEKVLNPGKEDIKSLFLKMEAFTDDITICVKMSAQSQEFLLNSIYYSSVAQLQNSKLGLADLITAFNFFSELISRCEVNEKSKSSLLQNIDGLKRQKNLIS